ncbi:MAG: hypothetical protein KDB06_11945 [Ilumatobacter sp.]|nr:hypothetical protein [Ilumatobacter sp.]
MLLLEVVNDRVDGEWEMGRGPAAGAARGARARRAATGGVLGEAAMRLTGPDGRSGGADAGSGAPATAIGE